MASRAAKADPRNVLDGPRRGLTRAYVAAVIAGGAAVSVAAAGAQDWSALGGMGGGLWLVVGLLVLSEARPLFAAGSRDAAGLSLGCAFVYALLLGHDLAIALVAQAAAVLVADSINRKALWRTAFNLGQYALSWSAAWAVLRLTGMPSAAGHGGVLHAADLLPALCGAVTYFAANELLVVRVLSLRSGTPLLTALRADIAYDAATSSALLALSPLVLLAAAAGPAFVPLLLPSLGAVYVVASISLTREQQALTDVLTGLANRKMLAERTAAVLSEGPAALVLLDLDRFKEVNDTLGHHVGDCLLQVVAQRLQQVLRPDDVVARLGGDEFALLLPGADARGANSAAQRARVALTEPIRLEGLLVDVGASAGIAVSPADGNDLDALLQRADVAMYLSKESGEVEHYDSSRDRNTPGRLALLGELRHAVEAGELELHYQPKADVLSGRVVGVEALVRWRHPLHGLVPPDEFIPLAERSGLIQPITAWVLDAALAQSARWRAVGWQLDLAVNVTVKDLCGDALVGVVADGLAKHGVPASTLQLEVTEGSLFADPVRARGTLARLETMGVALSLDDFGTGWSSLSQLRSLPVREIKVDRSFVSRMDADARDHAIVSSVIDLARGLGMHVVAEGVEDVATLGRLLDLGCDSAQGWWLSKALPPAELDRWLADRLPPATVDTERALPVAKVLPDAPVLPSLPAQGRPRRPAAV